MTRNQGRKKIKWSFDEPNVIKYNSGDENSIYRALEDAGAEMPWGEIRKEHENLTKRPGSSQLSCPDKIFLEEFAKNNKLTITFLNPINDLNSHKGWETIHFNKNRPRNIFIRKEQVDSRQFTALFFIKHPSFEQAINLRTQRNSKFPRHWPPKDFVGCKEHIDILEKQWRAAFKEVNTTVTEARLKNSSNINCLDEVYLDHHKKQLICGLFARPKSGKSYCFNRLILSGLIPESETDVLATIGPSETSNAIHTIGVTKLPIRAVYNERQLSISLKYLKHYQNYQPEDLENDRNSQPLIIFENIEGTEPLVTKENLEQIAAKVKEYNEKQHLKTAYIELLIPSPFLKSVNIELIDLPGYVATVDETQHASQHINDIISIYFDTQQDKCPLLDAVVFLTPGGRTVSESVYLDLYRCDYFSAMPIFLPKLIYLVNSNEGLEKAEDYRTNNIHNNMAKARNEVKHALTSFISHEENSVCGIDPDYISIISNRAAATPFFGSTFRGFNTATDLANNLLEVRFHKLRCKMLELIKEELVKHIFMEKLKIVAANKGDRNKLNNLLKKAEKIQTNYKNSWQTFEKENVQDEHLISSIANDKFEDSTESGVSTKKHQLNSLLRKKVEDYGKLLYEYSQREKMKLIGDLQQLNSTIFPETMDGFRSEAFLLINNLLNEATEKIQKDSPRDTPLPPQLFDAANSAISKSDYSRLNVSLSNCLKQIAHDRLTSNNPTSLMSYTLPLCQKQDKKEPLETLQRKVIKYENLLRDLQLKYSFFKTPNRKGKKLLDGVSTVPINRHSAATKDKELEKELSTNLEKPNYFKISSTDGSDREISVVFDLVGKDIEIRTNVSKEILDQLKQTGYYQPDLIHPIFIPTKLRGRPRGETDVEVVVPQLYQDQLQDFPGTFVIPVVDRSESERYWRYIDDASISVKIMMVIDDSNSNIPINIGRKRHIIKLVAEQCLKLNFYWVIDDDIEMFVEMGELLYRAPCTIGKALHFAQRVLQQELNVEEYKNQTDALFRDILGTHPSEAVKLILSNESNSLEDIRARNPDDFRKLCEETNYGNKLINIEKGRLLRVGQIALYNINDKGSEKRNILIKEGNFSHINRGQRYQVVLFNRVAMEGIEYMSQEDFFTPYRKPETISIIDMTTSDKKEEMAKKGYMHEDWNIVQQMKAKNRLGYLVFRYGFNNFDRSRYPSLVHNVSRPVPINIEISLDSDDCEFSVEEDEPIICGDDQSLLEEAEPMTCSDDQPSLEENEPMVCDS